ncbi:dsDNA nuclease domain-containing protein [Halomonas sp. AOP25-F1-15]|uniref:dsDNA nuclease domain-containing protein n=1 Tax=Halomonas sp. AOP25-F1-15 TaxID=3457709 RepID=UPI004033EDEF
MADSDNQSPRIHEVAPRENVGRDTIARYQAQFRGAAFECLSLLEDEELDRVYCDYQDDFVSRLNLNGDHIYNFYQVKTKKKLNDQWSVNDILGMRKSARKADPSKIASSYLGKLLVHTIKFNNSCGRVVFLTNIHFDDDVENLREAIDNGSENNHYKLLLENFNESLCPDSPITDEIVIERVKKLQLKSNTPYLNPEDNTFFALARDTIYKYSEIDLQHSECEGIINNLVSLVERKSFGKLIEDLDESELDEAAGIGLLEMLDILSISKEAYRHLKSSGDLRAIKNASIIHRIMSKAGASERMIEYVSDCKVRWDIWFRDKRHTIPEFDLNFILDEIEANAFGWTNSKESIKELKGRIRGVFSSLEDEGLATTLNEDLLLGAVFSTLVRGSA